VTLNDLERRYGRPKVFFGESGKSNWLKLDQGLKFLKRFIGNKNSLNAPFD